MEPQRVLIVDDEKNIRLTLVQTLEPLGVEVDTAANGEEALGKLEQNDFGLILLDLKMPGMDGMQVLEKIREVRPDIRVIIITAYGSIESAVEAMKLGAVDFIQKPFAPVEIRGLVSQVFNREAIDEQGADDYAAHFELAKKAVSERHFEAAIGHVKKAISMDPGRAEAFNLLGALQEIKGERLDALKNYRAALSLDPTYEPAQKNLDRSTSHPHTGSVILGDVKKRDGKKEK